MTNVQPTTRTPDPNRDALTCDPDMTDDLTLLASTYLDGAATPDERARVEADPALLAEVERLRSARAALLDAARFERPADDVRDAAIASALAAWNTVPVGIGDSPATAPVRRAPVVRLERRRSTSRSTSRWLSVAAAVVAVAALGVVIAQIGGGGDDAGDESVALDAPDATEARAETDAAVADQFESPSDTADQLLAGDVAADDSGGSDADAQLSEAAAATVAAAAEDPPDNTAAPAPAADVSTHYVMETPEELAAFASDAKAAVESDTSRGVLTPPCAGDALEDIDTHVAYVATGTYRGRSVVIGVDDQDERAIAVDRDTCEIVAEAPLTGSG
jgi:hypothetical protein